MRKLVLFAHMSLDGFAGDKNGGLGFLSYGSELQKFAGERVKTVGAPVYGKNTYHLMEGYWPTVLNNPNADKHALEHAQWVQEIPKIVFSTTLATADWNNTTLIKENVVEEVNKLKQQPGKDILTWGGATFANYLISKRLIDEYNIRVSPKIFGRGKTLFRNIQYRSNLSLIDVRLLRSGTVMLRYKA